MVAPSRRKRERPRSRPSAIAGAKLLRPHGPGQLLSASRFQAIRDGSAVHVHELVSLADGGDGVHNRFGLAVGDMPVYTLHNKTTGELKVVTDPVRALITGK
jgi:hypothetical protein